MIIQTYNNKINAFIKYKKTKKGTKILDVKQKKPNIPFKGVLIK